MGSFKLSLNVEIICIQEFESDKLPRENITIPYLWLSRRIPEAWNQSKQIGI